MYFIWRTRWWSHIITSLPKDGIDGISLPQFFTKEEVDGINQELKEQFETSPLFPPRKSDPKFGSFVSLEWSLRSDYKVPTTNRSPLPPQLASCIKRLCAFVPEQQWDLAFVHCYKEGEGVPRHKDPHQQLGIIILASFGEFEGGQLLDCNKKIVMEKPGDVAIMRCRIPGFDRPWHEVTPVTTGTRYSLMISTLIIPDVCKATEVEWQ
jgi:hypothetical protein